MLRAAGGLMIFAGCLGLGLLQCRLLTGRVEALRLLARALELLSGEIRFCGAVLPECCSRAASQLDGSLAEGLRQVGREMGENTGATFAEVFRERLRGPAEEMPLKEEDRKLFFSFLSETGFPDRQMQLNALELCCERMADRAEQLERANAEKCRMAVGLGAMGGLLLILALW